MNAQSLTLVKKIPQQQPESLLFQCAIIQKISTDCESSPTKSAYSISNNIHEKISPFWLVKSNAVFFLKKCRKELIQGKKKKQT